MSRADLVGHHFKPGRLHGWLHSVLGVFLNHDSAQCSMLTASCSVYDCTPWAYNPSIYVSAVRPGSARPVSAAGMRPGSSAGRPMSASGAGRRRVLGQQLFNQQVGECSLLELPFLPFLSLTRMPAALLGQDTCSNCCHAQSQRNVMLVVGQCCMVA